PRLIHGVFYLVVLFLFVVDVYPLVPQILIKISEAKLSRKYPLYQKKKWVESRLSKDIILLRL
ncbi:MAG TPA: hypothetical protein QF484_04115, partial [Candidatus Marinimicrobia bacterium]|nr:hypothetical protein [Candidatus Neomarinimicrobiota bacterium]